MSISREALIKALKSAETQEATVTNARRTSRFGRTARRRAVRNEGDEDEGESDVGDDIDEDAGIGDKVVIELDPDETAEVEGTIVDVIDDEEGEEPEYEEVATENLRRRFRKVKNARIVRNGRGGYTVLAPVTKKYRRVKNSRWSRLSTLNADGLDGRYTSTGDVPSGYDEPEDAYASELKGVEKPNWDAGAVENVRRQRIINARKAKAYDAIVARARRIRNAEQLTKAVEETVDETLKKRLGGATNGGFVGSNNSRRVKNGRKPIGSFRIKNYRVINAEGDDITAETLDGGQQPQPEDQQVIQLELVIDGGQDIQPEDIDVQVAGEGVPQEVEEPTADPGMNDQGQGMLPEDENIQNGRVRNARRRIRNARRRSTAVHNEETVVNNANPQVDSAPLDVPSTFPEQR